MSNYRVTYLEGWTNRSVEFESLEAISTAIGNGTFSKNAFSFNLYSPEGEKLGNFANVDQLQTNIQPDTSTEDEILDLEEDLDSILGDDIEALSGLTEPQVEGTATNADGSPVEQDDLFNLDQNNEVESQVPNTGATDAPSLTNGTSGSNSSPDTTTGTTTGVDSPPSTDTSSPAQDTADSTSGGGSVSIPTETTLGGGIGVYSNQLGIPLVVGEGKPADVTNGIINQLNETKAKIYSEGASFDLTGGDTSMLDVFNADDTATFQLADGSIATKQEIMQGKEFSFTGSSGFYTTVKTSQPLQNYETFLERGIPLDQIQIEPLPPQELSPVELPDFSSLLSSQEGTVIGRGETSAIDELGDFPEQSKTDITGDSGQ